MDEERMKQQWGWFKESCKRRGHNAGTYKQYKIDMLEVEKGNNTPEGKKYLHDLGKSFNNAMEMLA